MTKNFLQPIDQIAFVLMLVFSLVIGVLVWAGKACPSDCFLHTGPRVQQFSWQDKLVGAKDLAFILTFDRPMDQKSVAENLVIDPPLPGKLSWAGRRLAYTLETPVPYGESYQLQLEGAKERFIHGDTEKLIQPFVGQFRSRDRAFAYIGSQGDERGRLIFYNLTQDKKILLTPPQLVVMDFKFYPQGDRILFSAADKNSGIEGIQSLQLYTVTTGFNRDSPNSSQTPNIELVLDNRDYQNNHFDLSPDGQTIVVQRVNRKNPADFDLWMLKSEGKPERLHVLGGDFLIAPDSQTLAVAKGEGIGLLPLEPGAEPLDFLPKFGQLLSFSNDGSAAALVNFNTDNAKLRYTRSLFYVNNQGIQKELLNTDGSIVDCQFDPAATHLYCLLTQLVKGKDYQEQSYFAKVDLKAAQVTPLATLPNYQDIQISMAPDGLGLLFDQVRSVDSPQTADALTTNTGEIIIEGRLWLLIPPASNGANSGQPQLEELPLAGFRPQWLP